MNLVTLMKPQPITTEQAAMTNAFVVLSMDGDGFFDSRFDFSQREVGYAFT